MPNTKDKKTIGFEVPASYRFKGKEVKSEIVDFFQYVVDKCPASVLKAYPKLKTAMEVLGTW